MNQSRAYYRTNVALVTQI